MDCWYTQPEIMSCASLSFSFFVAVGLQFDFSTPTLAIIVPWLLAVPLRDPKAEPRAELEHIVKNKVSVFGL